jgi:hypothetical protein
MNIHIRRKGVLSYASEDRNENDWKRERKRNAKSKCKEMNVKKKSCNLKHRCHEFGESHGTL